MSRLCHPFAPCLLACLAFLTASGAAPLDGRFLRDFAETRGFRHGRPTAIQIGPRGEVIYFLRSGPRSRSQSLFVYEVATGRTRELVTPAALADTSHETLSPAEAARRERLRLTAAGLTSYELGPGGREILMPYGDGLFLADTATGAARRLPLAGGAFDARFSPDGRDVGFTRDHDVWLLNLASGRERQVTRGGTAEVSHGEAEFVAAEEMGRHTGWWWAPDGRSILYQESDARGVELWHVADPARPQVAPRPQFYPRPGQANVRVRLGVVGVRGGRTTWLKWDTERLPYFAHADWHPAGGLTLTVQSRDQRELVLLRADPRTGTTTPLLTERDEAWVNLMPRLPAWLADGSGFLWASERAGAWQLELRAAEGTLRRVLVPPAAGFRELVALDTARREAVFTAGTHPARSAVFRVPLEGGATTALADEPGLNTALIAPGTDVWVRGFAGPQAMPRSFVMARDGRVLGELPSVAEEPGVQPRAEIIRAGEGEGEGFWSLVVRPQDFDPARQYPVIAYPYGGPGHAVVQDSLATWLLPQWLADQGFLVVRTDNRGTPHRGRAWERAIRNRFAEVPVADQAAALRILGGRLPELDLARVGIVGWSFGGYLAAAAVLREPTVFHAAVAGAPVTDWLDYDTHYTERYLGVPAAPDDPIYRTNSLLANAPNLARPLLLIHGTGDDNVFFRHSLKLGEALFRAGRPFELLPLPGLTHQVPDPVVMERQWTLTAEFFQRHLGRPK